MLDQAAIVAVSSPPGASVRGLVRVSGVGAASAMSAALQPRDASARPLPPRSPAAVRVPLGGCSVPALATVFPGPGSATGEDVVELLLPGQPDLLERVVDWIVSMLRSRAVPARRAAAGEFMARAFLNGRIELTAAEGVAAAIAARTDAELRAAHLLMDGALAVEARTLTASLTEGLALVEAGIDFTDQEDVVAVTPAELLGRLDGVRSTLRRRLDRAIGLERLQAVPWVVLAGRANAGKSTLLNALVGHERAVVSAVAGTTRDAVAEPVTLAGPHGAVEALLVDVAGEDDETLGLNPLMQAAAASAQARASIVLRCSPADEPPPSPSADARILDVCTKSDLAPNDGRPGTRVSAARNEGLDVLRRTIALHLADEGATVQGDAVALSARQESALRDASARVDEAIALVDRQQSERTLSDPELVAAALRGTIDALEALIGRVDPDEVLGLVFGRFCVGK
ncbi:MAG: 50S ribosome-binding GTPase [Phycisphaerales bacterium]|nr:50S ribosome-binding GTPase [Phycisphaerales bacterium]